MINLFVNETLVDLSQDFDLLITRSIADIKNPEQRSSDWSKTITIPGTKTNNILFGNIFEVSHTVLSNGQFVPNFNPNKKANVLVLVDGLEQLRGFIRMIQINVLDKELIEYECSLHGQTADLFTTLGNAKLSDLSFDEYNHTLTDTIVKNSWDTSIIKNGVSQSFQYGEGYVYGQMLNKYGSQNTNVNEWRVDDHVPCLYAKTIIDKIMSNVGYQYTSDSIFNTDRFKRLIIPYTNYGFTSDDDAISNRLFQAGFNSAVISINPNDLIQFNNDSTSGNFDNGGNFNTTTYRYIAPIAANFDFFLKVKAIASFGSPIPSTDYGVLTFGLYKNGVLVKTFSGTSDNDSNVSWNFDYTDVQTIQLIAGDYVQVKYLNFKFLNIGSGSPFVDLYNDTKLYNQSAANQFSYNNAIDFGLFFSGDYTQKDLLLNFVKMFNLYIEQDADNPKNLRFVPRDDFYNGSVQDWSTKLDYSQNINILPMGDLEANPYIFTYKEGEDSYNKDYKQATSRIYGDRTIRIDNDFVKQEKKIELTFAPTMLFESNNKYFSVILNTNNDKGQLRCLYYGGVKNTYPYEVYNTTASGTPNTTKYPLTLHIDNPDNMQFDLNFGMATYVLTYKGLKFSNQNLVNVYWYKTIKEITDKNSKVFKGYFRINPYTWYNIRFNDIYFFENQYWRLNKISDYNPLQDGVYLCEFILVQYYEPTNIKTKNVGVGGGDVLNDYFPFDKPVGFSGTGSGGINIGDSGLDSKDNIIIGNGNVSSGKFATSIIGGTGVNIPPTFEYVTTINCTDYTIQESNRVYIENYPVVGAWLGGGKIIELDNTDSPYTATYDDYLMVCDNSAGDVNVVLPNPSTNKGKVFVFKKLGSNHHINVTAGDGSIYIDDALTYQLSNDKQSAHLISSGTKYYVIVP